jgi:hypothetical protein
VLITFVLKTSTSPGYDVSARALTSYPGDLNHCRSFFTPASEDGLKESPKHVRQKRLKKKLVHYVGHYTISFQNARSLQHKIKKKVEENISMCLTLPKSDLRRLFTH